MRMFSTAAIMLAATCGHGQDAQTLLQRPLAVVSIDGSLNIRSGPAQNAARVTRLNNGAVLRRVACLQIEDEDWCEIETLDGSLEGWASAVYLRPWFGADPAVLETLALPAGETVSLALPGGTTGVLKPGEIIDVQIEASAETAISFYFDGPEGVEMAIFEQQGNLITAVSSDTKQDAMLTSAGALVARVADLNGQGGAWNLTVQIQQP